MALTLPPNFKNDLQTRDTSLIPLIIIGNWYDDDSGSGWSGDSYYISTNVQQYGSTSTLPILLNIPSLKESIDVEKRNYKISAVNLSLSNYKISNGKRFSDLVADRSLINMECRIFWTSPSATNLQIPDFYGMDDYETDSAFEVYFGTIRRYEHDDEKVKLVVEDRSQSKLHKPFPPTDVGDGVNVLDKYKNKPIPMVYGTVDRSPCVAIMKTGKPFLLIDSAGNSMQLNENDSNPAFNENLPALMINKDAHYLYVQTDQYEVVDPDSNGIYLKNFDVSDLGEALSVQTISVMYYYKPKVISLLDIDFVDYPNLIDSLDTLYNMIDSDISTSNQFEINRTTYNSDDLDFPLFQLSFDTYPDFGYLELDEIRIAINHIIMPYAGTGIGTNQAHEITSVNVEDQGLDDLLGFDEESTADIVINKAVPDGDATTEIQYWILGQTEEEGTFRLRGVLYQSVTGYNVTIDIDIKIKELDIKSTVLLDNIFEETFYANVKGRKIGGDDGWLDSLNIGDESGSGRDRFAWEQIRHIMVTELGVAFEDISTDNRPTVNDMMYDWRHDYTVSSKIDSKKLLEGLASTTPYIPRFNNMGKFKLDMIPSGGGTADHTIKEDEVIDFTFSRTKIEDVKTKVIFKYNWDYAREDFNSSVGDDIDINTDELFPTGYNLDYYGLNSDHSESTLTIDDDRGKYIRDHTTAEQFAWWILSWHCNQHLKIKAKLPLKYMLVEVGDICAFDKVLGGVLPYGIRYGKNDTGVQVNGQTVYSKFLITSTNKTLEWVEIECIMLHALYTGGCPNDNYDCAGVCGGDLIEDVCNDCVHPDQAITDITLCAECPEGSEPDCAGICEGDTEVDDCGVCGGEGEHDVGCWDGAHYCSEADCPDEEFWGFNTCLDADANVGQYQQNWQETCPDEDWVSSECTLCPSDIYCEYDPMPPEILSTTLRNIVWNREYYFETFGRCNTIEVDMVDNGTGIFLVDHFVIPYRIDNIGSGDRKLIRAEVKMIADTDAITLYGTGTGNSNPYHGDPITIESGDSSPQGTIEYTNTESILKLATDEMELFRYNYTNPDTGQGFYGLENGDTFTIHVRILYWVESSEEEQIYLDIIPIEFTYYDCVMLGDVNGDGDVNALDILMLINCILVDDCENLDAQGIGYSCAADVNGNGEYNLFDITELVHLALEDD